MLELLKELDITLSTGINHWHGPTTDIIFNLISERLTWLPLYAILALYMYRTYGLKVFVVMLFSIGIAIAASDQISVAMKYGFERLRPCHELGVMTLLHLPAGCGGQFGFVSSHAANTASVAMLASLFSKNKWISIIFVCYAILNSYSRVYLGKHYVGDVVGGITLGIVVGLTVFWIYKKILPLVLKPTI